MDPAKFMIGKKVSDPFGKSNVILSVAHTYPANVSRIPHRFAPLLQTASGSCLTGAQISASLTLVADAV